MISYEPVLTKISAIEPEELSWLWDPYIPEGKITILDGLPGTGKTYFALAMAAALSTGSPICDEPAGAPVKTIYMTREDGIADTIRPRLDKLDADGDNILILQGSKEPAQALQFDLKSFGVLGTDEAEKSIAEGSAKYQPFDLSQIEVLETALNQVQPKLVIVDNVTSFLGLNDMNNAQEIAALLNKISNLAQQFQCAFLLIRHPSKSAKGHSIHRGAGSFAFAGVVRSMLLIGKDPEDPSTSVLVHHKFNLSKQGQSIRFWITDEGLFAWCGYCDVTASQLIAPESSWNGNHLKQKELAKDLLIRLLRDGAQSANLIYQVAERAKISGRTIERAKEELGILSVKSSEGWSWTLPDNFSDLDCFF
jgi:hypothetical protein